MRRHTLPRRTVRGFLARQQKLIDSMAPGVDPRADWLVARAKVILACTDRSDEAIVWSIEEARRQFGAKLPSFVLHAGRQVVAYGRRHSAFDLV